MQIRKKSGEVIDVDTEEILDASDLAALIGREDDPVVQALISEIRRLGTVLANQRQEAPTVNVSPTPVNVSAPAVSLTPNVMLNTPRKWVVNVTEHYMTGQLQGKIKQVEFIAAQ